MLLSEAVDFYHSLEKFGIMPGLERITLLCERLGSPHKKLKIIHVAGTNGKGSTCTALQSVLTKAGYKTGLYTSPYVIEFRERIQIDNSMISPEELCEITGEVREAVAKLNKEGIKITEFEAVTAAAFTYYARQKCDFAVFETGLGGRFDATNIVPEPLCSIITSVSTDHVNVLGNTLSEIAFEKCGIIKKASPVITGAEQKEEVLEVIKNQAALKESRLIISDSKNIFSVKSEGITGTEVECKYGKFAIPFIGMHQLDNMALVVNAVEVLRAKGIEISDKALCDGIQSSRIPARIEIMSHLPLIILDGSHNEGSTKALADVINKHLKGKKILAVMGMMRDKDVESSLSNLIECFTEVITVKPSNPRSMDAEALADIARSFSVNATAAYSPEEGIKAAVKKAEHFDALIVCGSLYLAGDVRNLLSEIIRGLNTAEE